MAPIIVADVEPFRTLHPLNGQVDALAGLWESVTSDPCGNVYEQELDEQDRRFFDVPDFK